MKYYRRIAYLHFFVLICSLLSCVGVQYLHPRHDPSTKQLHIQAKDKGVKVALIINIPIRKSNSKNNCDVHDNRILRLLSVVGLSLKYTSSQINYVVFAKSNIIDNNEDLEMMSEISACYKTYFKNEMDVTVVEMSKLRKLPLDMTIVIQPSVQHHIDNIVRGKVHILATCNIFPSYSISLSKKTLYHLSSYDLVLVPVGEDSEVYPAMLRHMMISTSTTSSHNLLPALHYVILPISDRAMMISSNEDLQMRDISVFVGSLSRGMSQELAISQAFKLYMNLKRKLFPLYDMTLKSVECDGKVAGKMYIIGYRSEEEVNIAAIAQQANVPTCQYTIIDRYDDEALYQALFVSSVLWHVEDVIQPSIMTSSCLYQTPGSSLSCEMINFYHAVDINRNLIQHALALNCIPIALHTSSDSFSRDTWSQKMLLYHYENGFIAQDYDEMLTYTQLLMTPPYRQIERYQTAARNIVSEHLTSESSAKIIADMMIYSIIDDVYRHFIKHTIGHMRSNKLLPAPIISSTSSFSPGYVAVIIEPAIHYAVEYSIRNALHHLGSSWGLRVYHSSGISGNEEYLRHILSDIPHIDYRPIPDSIFNSNNYDAYLKSSSLWQSLATIASHIMIFQHDTLLLRFDIQRFMAYNYIGAPWHQVDRAASNVWLRRMQRNGSLRAGIGDGSLSIRNPRVMLNISILHAKGSNSMKEDAFYASYVEKMSYSNTSVFPTRTIAYDFALQVPCHDIRPLKLDDHVMIPYGIHAAWRYVDADQAQILFNLSLPSLSRL